MSNTKIFISSTFFDLEQVRENLRIGITELGHIPILSEHPSFSILPDLDTISNCKRNVKENCDIFILIIGGKRGSVDPTSTKSIVNIEYDTAISTNKDIFIFVDERVNNLLEIWRKNHSADFTPQVDNPKVFEFLDTIKSSKKWIFTFQKAEDIVQIIKLQLSVFLKHLIDRKNSGKLDPIKEFLDENEIIQQLVVDRPDYWEFKLTAELLKSRIITIDKKFNELDKGLYYTRTKEIDEVAYLKLVSERFNELIKILKIMEKILNEEFAKSWGPIGKEGNPLEIKYVVDKLSEVCMAAFEWEVEIRSYLPPDSFIKLNKLLYGSGKMMFETIKKVPSKLLEPFLTGNPANKHYTINLEFQAPKNIEEISKEIEKLNNEFGLFFN